MKILTATHLALGAAITAVLAFVIAAITFNSRFEDSLNDRQMLYSITQGIAELQIRTQEYLNPNRFDLRPLRQWRARDAAIQQALDSVRIKGASPQKMIDSLIARQQEIRSLFGRLVEMRRLPDDRSILRAQQQRLLGRLLILFEEQLDEADELRRATLEADRITINRATVFGAMLLSLLLGAVVLAVGAVQRGMAPLQRMLDATRALGNGDFSERVGTASSNEIGVLGRAFDTMAQRLQSVTSSRDELKRVEEALRRLNETLEERVAARTAELQQTHEQLRQSQKMEAVGQLTGGIAHDFNNLLAGVVGNLEMMRIRLSQGRIEELPRYIESMMAITQRAAALTHRLLAFSRRQTLDPKPTDIGNLIHSMNELIERTLGPGITLDVICDEPLWHTLCDAHQLENALLNLTINARDAMAEGGQLTICALNADINESETIGRRDVAPGQFVAIMVADTGTGMSADVLARVFDPFFTTKPIGQGTGLGLSMIYGFVKQSGGYIRIDSMIGSGTRIWIYLPRYTGRMPNAPANHIAVAVPATREAVTVLVVDDEQEVRMSAVEMLEELGYRTIQAADGKEALAILESDRAIDLMVTDVGLPGGLNGCQVAEQARLLRSDLKVLFITGYAQDTMLGNSQREPGMEVLNKPFTMSALASKVRAMLEPQSLQS